MGDHEQRLVATAEVTLEPLNHLKVQVVGRLVEDEQVGFRDEHVGQSHSLLLSAAELRHALAQVANLQLRQYLLGTKHLLVLALVVEAGIEHRVVRVEVWPLLQIAHSQVVAEDDLPVVVALLAGDDRQQRGLSCAVFGNESYLLPLGNGERDVLEQHLCAERFGQILYVNVGIGHLFSLLLCICISRQAFVDAADVVQHFFASQLVRRAGDEVGGQFLPFLLQVLHPCRSR